MWVRIRCCVPAWHALACSRPHYLHADVAVQLQQDMYAPLRVQRVNLVLEVVCWCASERNTLAWHALACSRPHTVHAAVAVQFQQGMYATLCCRLVQRGFLAFESWVFVRALVCSTLPGTLLRAQGLTLCKPPLPCRVQQGMYATLCCSIVWHLVLAPRVVCML